MTAPALPHFFTTDMESEVEYETRQGFDGLYVTATLQGHGGEVDSITYGPVRKLTLHEASGYQLETWGGTEPVPFQDCEAFEGELARGELVIFARWEEAYYMGCAVED